MIKKSVLFFNLILFAAFCKAQTDSLAFPKWTFSLGYGIFGNERTSGIVKNNYTDFAKYPFALANPNQNDMLIDNIIDNFKSNLKGFTSTYDHPLLHNFIEIGAQYRINRYISLGSRSSFGFNKGLALRSVHREQYARRLNQQLEATINLNNDLESQINLILFVQGSYLEIERGTFFRGQYENNSKFTATEKYKIQFLGHGLGFGFEWVEYFKNTWGYGISIKVGNDMHYRRKLEITEFAYNGEDRMATRNKSETFFLYRDKIPENANQSRNEPTYIVRDFLPYLMGQLTVRFIYLR